MRYRPTSLNERAPNNVILSDDDMIKARSHVKKIDRLPISQVSCLTRGHYSPKQDQLVNKNYRRPLGILPNLGGKFSPLDKHSAKHNGKDKDKSDSERLSLPVISNIVCLTGRREEQNEITRKSWRNGPNSRGQKNFLHHSNPTPILQRAREHRKELTKASSIIVPEPSEGDDCWVPSKWARFYREARLCSRNLP